MDLPRRDQHWLSLSAEIPNLCDQIVRLVDLIDLNQASSEDLSWLRVTNVVEAEKQINVMKVRFNEQQLADRLMRLVRDNSALVDAGVFPEPEQHPDYWNATNYALYDQTFDRWVGREWARLESDSSVSPVE